jgi:hypothetical protein
LFDLANIMPVTKATPFECPNCAAQYKLVRIETNETLPDQQLGCRKCGGPLHGREGRFISNTFWWIVLGGKRNARAHNGPLTH